MELGKLKELLGISEEDTSQDIPLQFVMDDVVELIMNYCNVDELPVGLLYTAYRMAIDLYRNVNPGAAEEQAMVSSVTEGNTSTGFIYRTEVMKDTILHNYTRQLNRYRRLR